MRKKKYLLALLAFLVAFCLGMGYAAVTKTFNIGGAANATEATEEDFIITLAAGEVTNCTATVTDLTATLTTEGLTFASKKTATASFTITNESPYLNALIDNNGDVVSWNDADGYFKVTVTDLGDGANIANDGGACNVSVTIELLKQPAEAKSATFTITFDAEPRPMD